MSREASMRSGKKKYMLVKSRKFGGEAPVKYAGIEGFTSIIAGEFIPETAAARRGIIYR
jgi:DeoR/GlpR family transcriptional regulator of sugar metabolism